MATVLVVDDRPSNRQFLTTLLGYGGHRVLEAGDGAEALRMIEASRPDLVITDILMPKMDGYEMVQHLRARAELAALPVIFWTATYSASEAQQLALSCGVGKVLPKPCEPDAMLAAVSEALGAAPAETVPEPAEEANAPVSIDDSVGVYVKDLRAVRLKFDEIVKRSSTLRAERDRVRELSRQFSANVTKLQRITAKLSALIEIGMEMTSEREPERLVQLFFAGACDIVDAKIAAAGVLNEQETDLRYVVAMGVDPVLLRAGANPGAGDNFLVKLLGGHPPIRARSASAADAGGLPAGHPPVASFLGVPIASPDRVYGWLYFADRKGAKSFSEEDERLALIMAQKLALVYEHALLYDVIQRHAARLQVEVGERKRAEAALRESAAGLRRAQDMASLAHLVVGADGEFESWSETLPALFGIEAARMPKSTRELLPRMHPDDVDRVRDSSFRAGSTGVRAHFEYRLLREDGAVRYIRQVAEPMDAGAAGTPRRWFNTLQDVTQQRQAEEARRKAELEFRSIFENAVEGIFRTTRAGRVLTANEAAAHMFGYPSAADAVAALTDIGRQIYLDPADRDRLYRILAEHGFAKGFVTQFRRKDGSTMWGSVSARILHEPGEEPTLLGMIQDVTERKAAETRIWRLNRVYAVLSGINTLIVRVRSRDELFREACRIAVVAGQFRLAWIGMADREARRITVAAWSGDGEGFIERMPLRLDEAGGAQRGLAGLAIAERRPMISDDMAQDPRIGLREEAGRRGFHALAILPLLVSGEAQGVIALYAGEAGFFDDEEMKLLSELAGDIAFALEHLEALGRAEYLAFHDPLTGLPNRTVLIDHLDILLRAARRERRLAAVVLFDVERFRLVNETFGRLAGDALLKQVAERFQHATRAEDTLARVGADDFAVAVAGFHNLKEATHYFTERLTEAFTQPLQVDGQELRVALKAGVAVFPSDGNDAETLCQNAEAALKKAKRSGERYVFYTPEINARVADSLAMENRLRGALESNQFVLHYQPKVDVKTRSVVGLEALIRWSDPETGLVPPAKFIPLMEETGLILPVGRWALKRAVADAQAWRAKGYAPPRVAVNVSPAQLRQKDFVASVLEALEGFGDGEPLLDLEITESMVMQDLDTTIRALQTLGGVGVETYLDDFGTGYSSLAYVARLPVVALKIDRSFVIEMAFSNYARTIVQTVVSLAHSLGLRVVAEGVDDEAQVKTLLACGCDQMQGYLISKPVPPAEIEALLAKR